MSYQQPNVGDALSRGWQAFQDRLSDFLIVAVIGGVAVWVVQLILDRLVFTSFVVGGFGSSDETVTFSTGSFLLGMLVFGVISIVIYVIVYAYFTRIALAAVDQEQMEFADITTSAMSRLAPFFGWTFLAALVTFVGFMLFLIPGLIALFFFVFVPFFAMEGRGDNPFSASVGLTSRNAGPVILVMLVGIGLGIGVLLINVIFGLIPFVGFLFTALALFIYWGFMFCAAGALYRMTPEGALGGPGGPPPPPGGQAPPPPPSSGGPPPPPPPSVGE